MKKHKILFLIISINLLLSSCGSVQKAFDPQRKNNSDEFLVEKKSPLSTPPDFEKLPKPKDKQNLEIQETNENIEALINETQENNVEIKETDASSSNLIKLIIEKIKSN